MKQKVILIVALSCLAWGRSTAQTLPEHIKNVTAVSSVFGDGQKVKTVVVEYDYPINTRSLSTTTFAIEGREILRTYANTEAAIADKGRNGRFVVIELHAETDMNAQPRQQTPADEEKKQERDRMMGGPGLRAGWSTGGDDSYTDSLIIVQQGIIKTTDGKKYGATAAFTSTVNQCLVADDFTQHEFISPFTGQSLPYNLFLPRDYDPSRNYPLVLFIHDAGVATSPVRSPLLQGRGAVAWAEPEWQGEHPCIVVAPEYPVIIVDDNWNYSHHLDATIALLKDLQTRYSVDSHRIYTTGQSMGCMSSMVMMLKEPDLFAGALLVAGKWTPEILAPLAKQNIWIISCEGDKSSTELQNKAAALWRDGGNTVVEGTWNMLSTPDEFADGVQSMVTDGVHLYYSHLTGGSHRATWFVAYDIVGVREWLFKQVK